MNVTYTCHRCGAADRTEIPPGAEEIRCSSCGRGITLPPGAVDQGRLDRCLVCPGRDLYVRKDFPQRLGLAIVTAGFVASCVAWYYYAIYWAFGILFATALLDVLLFVAMPESLCCYSCGAQYRGVQGMDAHGPFHLEVHERYRQEKARLPLP